jgi:hypothetical protein
MEKLIKTGNGYIMSDMKEYRGLCTTCNNAPECEFLRHHNKTVYHCEEYDDSTSTQSKINNRKQSQQNETESGSGSSGFSSEEESATYKGLCVNCENRRMCHHARVEGGIWHCENYQ